MKQLDLTRYLFQSALVSCTALCCLILAQPRASAQQASTVGASSELEKDLQRIGTAASELMISIPSFTCDETAVSQAIRDGKPVRTVKLSGIVRAIRHTDGRLVETNDYKREHILFVIPKVPPLFVSGGFATALGYFLPYAQACYRYSMSPGRIDFIARTDVPNAHQCKDHGLKGFATLDAAGNVSHIERTVPPDMAKALKLATFASIDLAPVDLNGRMYQLSHHLVAEMPLSGATGRFDATYSNCHRFTASVTLGSSAEVPPESSPE